MRKLVTLFISFFIMMGLSGIFVRVSAHEVYVLSPQEFSRGLHAPTLDTFKSLANPGNLTFTAILVVVVLAALLILLYLRYTTFGLKVDRWLKSCARIGFFVIRIALAAAFLYGASTNSLFGPEISLHSLPFSQVARVLEYAAGGMLVLGLFTEVAAFFALILFIFAVVSHGVYLATYLNYFAEIVTLPLFGSRFLSLDALFFGKLKRFITWREYETTILRAGYGAALLYAAMYIKVIHSEIPLEVVNQYHLNQYHWLFPSDPLLIVLGAAIVEVVIALFIITGFSVRFTNLILMFYLTLSILFFRETVWPHYMLYGISISLLLTGGGKFSVDEALKESQLRLRNASVATLKDKKAKKKK